MAERDPECIFCRIINGEIPCEKIYEDEHVLAFLDIQPTSPGHTLVIPKGHYKTLLETPPDVIAQVARTLPKISTAVVAGTGAEGFNILQSNGACAGQAVFHIHVHIVPRRRGDGIGLGFRHAPPVQVDLKKIGADIRAAL